MGFLGIFGDNTAQQLKKIEKIVRKIEALEEYMKGMGDDALRAKTDEFRGRLQSGKETLDDLLPEAFARRPGRLPGGFWACGRSMYS